jgi:hypothetical protein
MNEYKQEVQDVFLNFRFDIKGTEYKAKITHEKAVELTELHFKNNLNYKEYINKLR